MLIPLKLVRDAPLHASLQEQLFGQLRTLIQSGHLQPGARMPSTRMLAEQFHISRTTVLLTYERLIAEHLLETSPATGTFVRRPPVAAPQPTRTWPDESVADIPNLPAGCPDPSLFPAARWRSLVRGALDRLACQPATSAAAGNPVLRGAIAEFLSMSRGVAVSPDRIVLTNSRRQALHVLAHALRLGGRRVVVEDPTDADAAAAFADADLLAVSVDSDGLQTDRLPCGPAALVHVTPEHQRPLGVRLADARRHGLLDWAAGVGAFVLEDDCCGELRTQGPVALSLASLDRGEQVIMLGGFATSLGPWLAQAYLVVPSRLAGAVAAVRRRVDDSRHWLEEAALAEFIASGGYARHVHRLGKAYASRRDALLTALRTQFDDTGTLWHGGAGLHLAWFPSPQHGDAAMLAPLARSCGLEATLPALPRDPRGPAPLLLGFGSRSEARLQAAVAQFAVAVNRTVPMALSAD